MTSALTGYATIRRTRRGGSLGVALAQHSADKRHRPCPIDEQSSASTTCDSPTSGAWFDDRSQLGPSSFLHRRLHRVFRREASRAVPSSLAAQASLSVRLIGHWTVPHATLWSAAHRLAARSDDHVRATAPPLGRAFCAGG